MKKILVIFCMLHSLATNAQQWSQRREYNEGLAAAMYNGKWGYVDSANNWKIPCKYDFAMDFSEGLGAVSLNRKAGFIDKTGKLIIDFKYEAVHSFSEGLAGARMDGKWGFIDKQGKNVIPYKFDQALGFTSFKDGLAPVRLNGLEGCIDPYGKTVIPFEYARVRNWREGMLPVKSGTRWGYINRNNKVAIALQYEDAFEFNEGLAGVKINGKHGFIDKKANLVINPVYDNVYFFLNGFAKVSVNELYGYIDRYGKEVVPLAFTYLKADDELKKYQESVAGKDTGEEKEPVKKPVTQKPGDKESEGLLKRFWQTASIREGSGSWSSTLPDGIANLYFHFRGNGNVVEVSEGSCEAATWSYDASTKKLVITYQEEDGSVDEEYKVVSVSRDILELERTTEEGDRFGIRFVSKAKPFFPSNPVFIEDITFNLDVSTDEARARLKQVGFNTDNVKTSNGVKITEYKNGSFSVFVHSIDTDVVGYVTTIETSVFAKMIAEFSRKATRGTHNASKRTYTFKINNLVFEFSNVSGSGGETPYVNGLRGNAWLGLFDTNYVNME